MQNNTRSKEETLTSKKTWKSRETFGVVRFVWFADLFKKYLRKSNGEICLEIGCVPGKFLAYICKTFGYFAEGIDYLEDSEKITGTTLKNNGINYYKIYKADFMDWDPPERYDLVCSFGFIEHFTGSLNKKVIKKHIKLVKPGGKLIVEVPNFRYCQYFVYYILNRGLSRIHNKETMNLTYYKNIARDNNLKILYLGYWGGPFEFLGEFVKYSNLNLLQKLFYIILIIIKKTKILKNTRNCFLSPFIVFIAEKRINLADKQE